MSRNAYTFIQEVFTDSALYDQVGSAGSADVVVNIARERGYDVTTESFRDAFGTLQSMASRELSESELDGVVGGVDAMYTLKYLESHFKDDLGVVLRNTGWVNLFN